MSKWLCVVACLAAVGCNKANNVIDTDVGNDPDTDTNDTTDTDVVDTNDTSDDTHTADTGVETGGDSGRDSSVDTFDTSWWPDTFDTSWWPDTFDTSWWPDTFDTGGGGSALTFRWEGAGKISGSDFAGTETFIMTESGVETCSYTWSSVTGADASSTISVPCTDPDGASCDFAFAVSRSSGAIDSGCASGVLPVSEAFTAWGYSSDATYYGSSIGSALFGYYDGYGWSLVALPDLGYGSLSSTSGKFTYVTADLSYY